MPRHRKSSTQLTVIFPDIHFAHSVNGVRPLDRHDPKAVSIAMQITKDLCPDRHIQLGDLIHLAYLSHWNIDRDMKGTVTSEKEGDPITMNLKNDHALINRYFDHLQAAVPRYAELHQFEGNHEEALRSIRNMNHRRGEDLSQWFPERCWRLQERGIKWMPYQRYGDQKNYLELTKYLHVFHGHYAGTTHLQQHFMDHLCSCIYGHIHEISEKSFKSDKNHISVKTIGCLATKYASYHRGRKNPWGQAISLVYTLPSGEFYDQLVRIINGKAVLNGKIYYGKEESWME